jgi:hypothetical protein
MLMIQSEKEAKAGISSFALIEPFMEALISHESIHVTMKSITDTEVSDSLDDLEVIVEQGGKKFQVTLNNILFATDNSGLVLP